MVAEGVVVVTDANYQQTVVGSPLPLLLGLGARWSGAWHALEPALQVIAQKLAGRLRVAAVDCDSNWEVVRAWAVFSYPTLILLWRPPRDEGEGAIRGDLVEVARLVGPRSARDLLAFVAPVLEEGA